ncbi:CsgG/HfaB family protein [Thermodesulfobacteriota bacterium]
MNIRTVLRVGLAALLVIYLGACVGSGKKEYDVGMQLSAAGKYKEAIAYLNQAIEKEPNNKEYQQALSDMKEKLVNQFVDQGAGALTSQSPVTIGAINKAKAELTKAQEIDPAHPAVKGLSSNVEKAEDALVADVRKLYADAKQFSTAGKWLEAYFNLQQVQSRFPNYEDSFQLLSKVSDEGSSDFYQQAKARFDEDDFRGAKSYLRHALSLKADYAEARELLSLAEERDSKGYFIEQAREAVMAQKWDTAVDNYRRALEYEPADQDLRQLIVHVRNKAGQYYIRKARSQMDSGWLLKAFEIYDVAGRNIQDSGDYQLNSLRNDLTSRAKFLAAQFKDQGQYGAAWYWYTQIQEIDPEYPEIFYLTQEMEDNIKARVQKSIAVFDFSSPSGSEDAGIIVANNLITFLFNNASGDIKILERENLKSILEEMKLGSMGVVSAQSAKEMGRVYGIDVAIMGSVLLFKVDTTVSEGTKSVRYQVGEKIEDNIEYLNWKAKNPNPSSEQIAQAPPAKIKLPEFKEKDYLVSNHKKVGFVQLSFRIVDVRTGENIQVRTIERKETAEDETSAGLPEADVKFDSLQISTNTELLQKMTDEVVADLGRETLRPLQNQEKEYFQDGENFLRRRDKLQAAESFVNAIFNENLKRIQESPISQKSEENIADIFREYLVILEG